MKQGQLPLRLGLTLNYHLLLVLLLVQLDQGFSQVCLHVHPSNLFRQLDKGVLDHETQADQNLRF